MKREQVLKNMNQSQNLGMCLSNFLTSLEEYLPAHFVQQIRNNFKSRHLFSPFIISIEFFYGDIGQWPTHTPQLQAFNKLDSVLSFLLNLKD